MTKSDAARWLRSGSGWFTICVWLVGAPKVVEYSIVGIKTGAAAFVCSTSGYGCQTRQGAPDAEEGSPNNPNVSLSDEATIDRAIRILERANPGTKVEIVAKRKQ